MESRLCTSLPSSSSSIRPRSKRMAAEKPESPVLISSLDASRASRLIHRSLSRKSWCRHSVFIRSMASITRPAAWSSQAQAELNNRQNRRNSWPISGFKGWVSRCRMVPNRITRDRLSLRQPVPPRQRNPQPAFAGPLWHTPLPLAYRSKMPPGSPRMPP